MNKWVNILMVAVGGYGLMKATKTNEKLVWGAVGGLGVIWMLGDAGKLSGGLGSCRTCTPPSW